MKTFFVSVFLENWERKGSALILAILAWLIVNDSLTMTRSISNVPVRVINIPAGETIEGLQVGGRLTKKLTLSLIGNKTVLAELTPHDFEIVLDASSKPEEWVATISKQNLVSLNPELDVSKGVSKVFSHPFVIRMTKLATDQISVVVTQPTGDPPRGYQFLDVWPYRLKMTVSGPETVIKRLKLKEQRITFDLSTIQQAELDALSTSALATRSDVVSFSVPDLWKQISLPSLSQAPLEIDDPEAAKLRIDFIRCRLLPIDQPLPIQLFFPQAEAPEISIRPNTNISQVHGVSYLHLPLYVNGVDRLFLQTVRNHIQIALTVPQQPESGHLEWSVQFIDPKGLEDRYVTALMAESPNTEEEDLLYPRIREEYLRNRFRSYLYHFQLFTEEETKLELRTHLENSFIDISCGKDSAS